MHNAKEYCLGSGVALQTPIPLYIMGQKRCFWIPGMGVFEMHNAKEYCLGSGVALQTPIPLYTVGRKRCFWIPGMGCLKWTIPKNIVWVQEWCPKHPYICTPWARKDVFGYLVWGCSHCAMHKNAACGRGAPSAHTSAPNLPERVFLDT